MKASAALPIQRVFFSATSTGDAAAILRQRGVRWVLAERTATRDQHLCVLLGIRAQISLAIPSRALGGSAAFSGEWRGAGAVRKNGMRFYRLYEVDATSFRHERSAFDFIVIAGGSAGTRAL